jgi:VIT1/CCC1 family predicted Fe2+/Mn2+ transporter
VREENPAGGKVDPHPNPPSDPKLESLLEKHWVAASSDPKKAVEALLAKRSHGGRQRAGWLGDAIYAANDGLGFIFGVVSGVSGATLANQKYVLLAGLSGMVASALSAAIGAYLAARGDREVFDAGVSREREAVTSNRKEAQELLSMYYQVKGLPAEDADSIVAHIAKNPHQLLRALTAQRLNATEEGLDDPTRSALTAGIATAVGAFIPVIPFFFCGGMRAVVWAAIVSLAAHFAVGASKSMITVRSWWSSGLELTAIGAVEGVITYVLGIGLGWIAS